MIVSMQVFYGASTAVTGHSFWNMRICIVVFFQSDQRIVAWNKLFITGVCALLHLLEAISEFSHGWVACAQFDLEVKMKSFKMVVSVVLGTLCSVELIPNGWWKQTRLSAVSFPIWMTKVAVLESDEKRLKLFGQVFLQSSNIVPKSRTSMNAKATTILVLKTSSVLNAWTAPVSTKCFVFWIRWKK